MSTANYFAPLAAATGQTLNLSMQRLWLTGEVLAAGARLVVEHVFRSDEEKPLEAIYCFPLPRDAALRSFRITGEGFDAHSELKETEQAVKAYEGGIAQGSLAAMARQYGDGVVNLTVGNIRPKETITVHLEILCGVELRDGSLRFRFPFTLAPTYHSRAKVAETAHGEGEMELPGNEFGDMILPPFFEDASSLHQVGFELTMVGELPMTEIGSPSHAVRVKQDDARRVRVALGIEKDIPNRDLVLDARFDSAAPQVLCGRDKHGKGHFAAIVPSACFGVAPETPRRVVFLVDRSASMQGAPIMHARKSVEACLGLLSEADSFGLVTFNQQASTFQRKLVGGTREWRDKAREFLLASAPGGGTELSVGILEAAGLLANGGGDVLILTDGQVSGTEKILADARSAGIRLHCLGIGSASQDRFLALLARETGGLSRFVVPGERVDLPAVDLFASIGRPVASGLKAGANVQPEPPSFVFGGTPVLLFGETQAGESGQLELTWDGGKLNLPVTFGDKSIAETARLLQGSRLITDWESRYSSTGATAVLERRQESRVAGRLLALSQTYGLASREMALVAVVTREGDRPGQLPETRVVPVGMPKDTAFGAYFGKRSVAKSLGNTSLSMLRSPTGVFSRNITGDFTDFTGEFTSFFGSPSLPGSSAEHNPEDVLVELASRMESDGGMPGKDAEARAMESVIAVLAFLSQGHTSKQGAFRLHVTRLEAFLKTLRGLSRQRQKIIDSALKLIRKGKAPAGDWIALARTHDHHWDELVPLFPRPSLFSFRG